MQSVRHIQRLNDAELEKCVPPNASWHTDYRDTAYIHFGGIPFELSEGDVLTIFSQYGNPVHISLIRDKETGKSRGFGFLKYEDQRSCDLAVDNLSGAGVLGRVMTVDHARYKLKDGEIEGEGMEDDTDASQDDDTDREDNRQRKRRRTSSEDEGSHRPRRSQIQEELELAKLLKEHDDDDPMKAYLVKEKKEQIAEALNRLSVGDKTHQTSKHQHRRRGRERDGHEREKHGRIRSPSPSLKKRNTSDRYDKSQSPHKRSPTRHQSQYHASARSRSRDASRRRRRRHGEARYQDGSSADESRRRPRGSSPISTHNDREKRPGDRRSR